MVQDFFLDVTLIGLGTVTVCEIWRVLCLEHYKIDHFLG